jgi:hypothetical protein
MSNRTFDIKCITHDQAGVCKEGMAGGSATTCEPVVNASTQVPGWTVLVNVLGPSGSLQTQTVFTQICNEIHFSFTLIFTEAPPLPPVPPPPSPSYVSNFFSYSLVPPPGITISSIVPSYQGAGQFQGTFIDPASGAPLPTVTNGRITASLNSVSGVVQIYMDSWITANALISYNTNFIMEGSLVFYVV